MAYSTINKSSSFMNTKLYTGTGSSNAITGVGFQPDLVWIKGRSNTSENSLFDVIRGVNQRLRSNSDGAQTTAGSSLTAFDADGFTVVSHGDVNTDTHTYASWNWKANGAGSANTVGSIDSTVSVNTTSNFSIVKYVGDGGVSATIGHGLGVKPKMFVVKSLVADDWTVYNETDGANYGMFFNNTDAKTDNAEYFYDTEPTSTVFTIGTNGRVNDVGVTYIAYCFAEVAGYSKISSYKGNNSANGIFCYTGFKPSFIMIKRSDTAKNWAMFDNKRLGYNVDNNEIYPNLSAAEDTTDRLDMLSNGFKIRHDSASFNADGGTYIYMAFGQTIVGTNNIPATAR